MPVSSHTFTDLTNQWNAVKRYTATGDIDVDLSNSKAYFLFFAITTDDTEPTFPVRDARPIAPMTGKAFQLRTGERLWLGGARARALLIAG